MNLISIPAFEDNYIWVLVDDARRCVIVDPGEAAPVLQAIKENGWQPEAILLTHHHHDHTGGVPELRARFPHLVVYGPAEAQDKGITQVVEEGKNILIHEWEFSVFATPGHTLGHLCFYSKPYLFCGDTLFSGGCGRLFEGTPAQMYQSLQKINALPDDTVICCAHEYTLGNMKFSASILPEDRAIQDYYQKVKGLRAKNQKTLPVILKNERKINLFLRTDDIDLINKINQETKLQQPEQRFAWLRSKKDNFR
ncbi:TPA: hydroxyacylglutathione hydrolase [Enterobacter cloacae]|uniref:hydroxyacylglutathione hydrolase n=1 Tax=Enterobacter cloacae complex TaxID=354276 RepID=UPI0007356CDB|nr:MULTISPECIES: hydroxyacylglutathione hydrolase [Enterobacter cloacae complex]KTI59479.1 hydroxyacylglutathione hydrolase [Enterobacter cloacae subsp. cloacae]KVI50193.1 hydroxyacylglutathione hydrolase [Enterobacter cloacae subsp. cloacae]MCM7453810.1 hydroxyacylglutathione hydrolase [Enterobacter cloacae]MDD7873278.1 hydroxyacylglutathione hydrolase [Enterobacter cloacae complex sp. 2022EL-00981]RTO04630.1 hydroxyacylglutathione hydrolase [Enterobacter cloacae]